MAAPLLAALAPVFAGIAERIVGSLSDVITGDSDQKRAARAIEAELIRHISQVDLAQIQVNLEEAKSDSVFVAGWRPFVGWTCAAGVAYAFVFRPLFGDTVATLDPTIKLPPLDVGELMTLLLGLLGMAGYRSWEKIKGVARRKLDLRRDPPPDAADDSLVEPR